VIRTRTPRGALLLSAVLSLGGLYAAPAASALTTAPVLTLNHQLVTSPFAGSTTSVRDNEGLAYVAKDNSLWMASDNDKAIFEINPTTGALKRRISRATFSAAPEVGTGAAATDTRDNDIEALAYDNVNDVLYVFSGSTSSVPAVYQLKRDSGGAFQVVGWRGLATEWTGAGFRPKDGKLYLANLASFATYDYTSNTFGPTFGVSGVTKVFGIDFAEDLDADMLVVSGSNRLQRVDLTTRTVRTGWNVDLTQFGMLDTRAVEVVGRQFFVSDGYDFRTSGDLSAHAIFVYDWNDGGGVTPPTAGFTATPTSGNAPLPVQFTDTSTGAPTSWAWDFGDGSTSTARNPSHTYTTAGTYTVTLVATNAGGPGAPKTAQVTVTSPTPAPTASFTASATTGAAPLTVTFTDTSTGSPTSWAWDFGDGTTSTVQNPPAKTFAAGTHTVTLRVSNAGGPSTATKTITVTGAGGATTTFTPDADAYFNTASPAKNYGAATVLKLHSPVTAEYRPLVRFAVTGLSGAPSKAVLRLWVTDASTVGGSWFKVSNAWTESTVTWNTKPDVAGAPLAGTAGAATLGTWMQVDVTSAVTGNGQVSFEATSTSTNTAAFASKESANAPQLVVTP
jgi:PKD repeat protein